MILPTDSVAIWTAATVVGLTAVLFALNSVASATIDPAEPPAIQPTIPFVGHLISMLTERGSWYRRLYKKSSLPIFTLPILNGKLYVMNSPALVQAAMRTPEISFDPFFAEFTNGMLGLNSRQAAVINNKKCMEELLQIIHTTLMGPPLHKVNVNALGYLAGELNKVPRDRSLQVANSFLWLRNHLTTATGVGLYGKNNPLADKAIDLLWTFNEGAISLSLGAPGFIFPRAVSARSGLNKRLNAYYAARHDEGDDVSDLIQKRAVKLREFGFQDEDWGEELILPWVGSTNTIPVSFWIFVHLFTNPDYLSRVRAEFEAILDRKEGPHGPVVSINVDHLESGKVEKTIPFLNAIWLEALRFYLHNVGIRRIMSDVSIKDGDGREYLLKKGVNIQWPPMVLHFLDSAWGTDAETFDPERFLNVPASVDKLRRGANVPFGGGKHLCPGRRFAMSEVLGLIGAVALGFDVKGLILPESRDPPVGHAPRVAVLHPGFKLSRRKGWEDVTFEFAG
ncbi:cytochrome P450 [Stachybotrys elegans]|uniref:Cytochrome P450 n=1 Tax=Stachybotrys elegans TaxID=80388 RepID=A0A8K0SKF1_9HYPO|nr:cytochrome P450 [Stachybotrys elegans]